MRTIGRVAACLGGSFLLVLGFLAAPAVAAIGVEPVVTGLSGVEAFTWTPNGRIFYGERGTGEIRIFVPSSGADSLFFDIPNLIFDGERGLLGLALHPDYPATPYVYAFVTRNVPEGRRAQIVRLTNSGGRGTGLTVIFSTPSISAFHTGGRILFGPDGRLYAVIGEGGTKRLAQNTDSMAGKVLRMRPNGTAAPGNPFGNRVWAYGIRNSFGMAFDPRTDRLWETDAGPDCNDELNRIVRGGNFAWGPNANCADGPPPENTNQDGPNRIMPERLYNPPVTPTGVVFCQGCGLGPVSEGRMFVAAFNTGQIYRIRLTADRLHVAAQTLVYSHDERFSITSMERDAAGRLYFTDGDTIFRLVLT